MGKQAYTENRKKNNKAWDEKNLKRMSLAMNIELYEQFDQYCKNIGKSKNGLINELVLERLRREGYLNDMGKE